MSESSRLKYLNYVKDVLGIKHLFFIGEKRLPRLLIAVENLNSYTVIENELLQKMIAAMALDPKVWTLCAREDIDQHSASFVLALSDALLEGPTNATMQTYSPRTLVKHPELKKKAWHDIQELLTQIK